MVSVRILLVDDDPNLLKTLVRVLRRAGHEVWGCGSPGEALAEIDHAPHFDLVITDLNLAEGTCNELLGEARRRSPRTRLMVLTGGAAPEWIAADVSVHAKPIGTAELLRAIDQQLA